MASRSDEHLSLMPDFSSRFDLDFNQAGPEWGLDPEFLGPSWKVPVNNSENTCPVTGSSGVSRCGSGSTTALHIEQVDDYLDMSMDSADILSDITWQLETGTDFSTTVLKRPTVAHSASREGVTAGSLKTGPYHFPEQSTMPARRPLASRPFSMPFSRSSRSSQLESSVSRSTTNVTSRKVNSIQKRKASAKKFLPMKLIGHLENEFQSNLTVSREFKRKSSEILGQLKKLIDNEKLHGSSGASMFLSPEEQVDDDQTSTGSTGMGSSSTNLILHMADLDSGFETHLGALAPASMSAQCTQTHNLVSRHAKTKTIYQCTYPKCVKSFISFHDWKRHEEIEKHWLQKRYMCLECDIAIADPENIISCAFCLVSLSSLDDAKLHSLQCQDAKDNNRTFARKDKFRDHLRDEHMIANIQEYMESWTFSIESNWPRRCGFCGAIFKRWEERAAHIEEHYKRGVRITAWKLPFSSGDDSAIENLDAIYENDSDDDEHGYQGQSSLQPYSYHLGGYPGNSSSAARVRGRGNSSASTDKEQQSNHRACGGDNAHQNHQTIDSARDLGCGSGSWSEEEEKHLLQLVNSNPERNWVRISSLIGSQTPKQCRDRYRKFLKPSMTDHPIKTEEAVSLEKWVKNSQILHYGSSQIINGGSFTSCPVRLAYRLVNSRAKSACSGSSENLTKDETRCTEDNKINDSSASPLSGLYQNPAVGLDGLYHCPWEGKDPFCDHKPEHLKSNYLTFVNSHLKLYSCKFPACNSALFPLSESLYHHEVRFHAVNRDASKAFLCPFKGCERGFPGNEFPRQWNLRDHMKRVHNYSPNPPSSMPIDSVGHETYLNIEKHTRSGLRVKICGLEYLACSDFGSSINIMSLDFATTCNIAIRKDEVDKRHVTTPLGNKSKSVGRACVACSLVSESGNRAAKGYWFYVLAQSSQDLILGKPFLQDFELLRCLQKSPHGTVEEVRHKTTLASMARKTLSLSPQNTDMARKRQFLNEVTMLHKLKRWSMVHIVKLEGMYASNESLTLLMSPAANCNLEDYMAETAKTSLPTKRRLHLLHWQSCLLSALACLHKHKINHKDISPTNILIKGNEILLSGFGLAVSYESNAAKSTQSEIEGEYFSCTSMYCAPEVAKRTSNGLSADVFSMGCVLLEMSTIIHGMRMKDMKEGQADNSDSKAYHCILESTGRWIDRLTSESRNAMQIWESVLGRENCKEYVVAVRRRLNVIRAMLSESPSNRPAAAVLIPLFDTKSFLAVRDSYSPGCDCKPTAFRRKSPPDSMPPQKNTRILKSNAFARTKSRDSLSTIKLEVQDTRRSVVTLPKRDLEARTADRPTSFFNPPKLSSDETEDSLEDRTVAGGEFCALQATGFY